MSAIADEVILQVRLIHPDAKIPWKRRSTDAGYDLYSIEGVKLQPKTSTIVKTGIQISAPPGYYYTIEGRSSLWAKGIFPNRGIIDSTFCGELYVSLVNISDSEYQVNVGDRIAQILLHKQYDAYFQVVEQFGELYDQRGQEGFGSTGR